MRIRQLYQILVFVLVLCTSTYTAFSQRYLSDYDSTLFIRDTVRPFLKRLENLHFSGYIQPQFQVAQSKGAPSFSGGNFADHSNNRFLLRRARIKVDYILPAKGKDFPMALFTFQFDVSERGAFARDVFLRLYEPKGQKLSLTMGLVARPFGYEVNLSSAYRESPERGRASQTLMPTERDLGAMASYETRKDERKKPLFKLDIGAFNGPGLSGTTDFDSYKDLISRFVLKPYALNNRFSIGAGLSLLHGGWMQATKYRYEMGTANNNKGFVVDSSESNKGDKAPRHYYGGDAQLVYRHAWGKTELRGEYWKGSQPGTEISTLNPGSLPLAPTYVRDFDAAFFYFLQDIVNYHWELVVKYDWYDPNTKVSDKEVGMTNTTLADVRFSTLGFGLNHYFNDNVKILAYYDIVRNEKTSLPLFADDIKDNVFSLRMQLRF